MKKLTALLIALILMLSLSPMALASTVDGGRCLCGNIGNDCYCGGVPAPEEEKEDLSDIDYNWYLPVYLQRSRDIFGLRENTVRVELRPELDEDGTLIYSMTENLENQLANNLRHIWLEEEGSFLSARTVVQYDLSYALERHKLAYPGESGAQPSKLKLENVPGLGDDGGQIRTKINVQELVLFEPTRVGAFSTGFSMAFQVLENGYEAEFVSDKGEDWNDMLMHNKPSMGDGGWKLNNGKWEYRFGEAHEEYFSDEYKGIYNEFSQLLNEVSGLEVKAENKDKGIENPDFSKEMELRLREEHAREKLNLTADNMSADRFFSQQGQLYWQVDKNTNAKLEGLLSLAYNF